MDNFARDRDRKRKALLIGNDNYDKLDFLLPLAGCLNDVNDLEEKFDQMGFLVRKVVDGTKNEMEINIKQFNETIETGDMIVFSFSGHGSEYEDENILYPIDTNTVSNFDQLHTVVIKAQNILDDILRKKPYFVLFILDCCRGYDHQPLINQEKKFPSGRSLVQMKIPNDNSGKRGPSQQPSWLIVLACATGDSAEETRSNRRNGRFTYHLLQHISREEHIAKIIADVCEDVIQNSNQSQTPHQQANLTNGYVCLNKNPSHYQDKQHTKSSYQNSDLEKFIQQLKMKPSVILECRNLTDDDMDIVATKAIIEKRCFEINLDGNCITSIGITKLVRGLSKSKALKGLHLEENEFYDEGVQVLANALSNEGSSVKWLYLGGNDISDEGVQYLSDMLRKNRKITHLWLNRNEITDQGVQMLCDTLIDSCSPLQELNLSHNNSMTNESVEYLCKIIFKLPSLQKIRAEECHLGERGINKLNDAINDREAQRGQPRLVIIT